MELKKKIRKYWWIGLIIIFIVLIILKLGLFSINTRCDETTYGSVSWFDNGLIYSGYSGSGRLCGGEPSSPKAGAILTTKHNYGGAWASPYARNIEWRVIDPSCSSSTPYPCRKEKNAYHIYPPAELVKKYPDLSKAIKNMECVVYGKTEWFGDYWGDHFDVSIPYKIMGYKVTWEGYERNFRCWIKDSEIEKIRERFKEIANQNNCWGHNCGMIYGSSPVIGNNAHVKFIFKEPCMEGSKWCKDNELWSCVNGEEKLIQTCEYGCVKAPIYRAFSVTKTYAYCKSPCSEGLIGTPYCSDNQIIQKYKQKNCSITKKTIKTCEEGYKCQGGKCVELIRCGDGICSTEENLKDCPQDCHKCGDGICTEPYENSENCSQDCKKGVSGLFILIGVIAGLVGLLIFIMYKKFKKY